MQGSVAFGLGAALHGELTFKDGRVQQSNFHDYRVLRINEMPMVDVHIVKSKAKMGGIGEPATAPIAPAVANAVFALTGQRSALAALPARLMRSRGTTPLRPVVSLTLSVVLLAGAGTLLASCSHGAEGAGQAPTSSGVPSAQSGGSRLHSPGSVRDGAHRAAGSALPELPSRRARPRCRGTRAVSTTSYVQRGPTGTDCPASSAPPATARRTSRASYGPRQPPGVSTDWHLPPPDMKMVFVGLSSRALCEQLKDPAAQRPQGHRRAGPAREQRSARPLGLVARRRSATRSPIPHADFVAAFKRWTDAGAPCPTGATASR